MISIFTFGKIKNQKVHIPAWPLHLTLEGDLVLAKNSQPVLVAWMQELSVVPCWFLPPHRVSFLLNTERVAKSRASISGGKRQLELGKSSVLFRRTPR